MSHVASELNGALKNLDAQARDRTIRAGGTQPDEDQRDVRRHHLSEGGPFCTWWRV